MRRVLRVRTGLFLLSVVLSGVILFAGGQAASRNEAAGGNGCVTDTWVATNPVGAPSPRFSHTAVWTGKEMIIWGGLYTDYRETYLLDTGARYDPATDTWTATTQDGAPTARFGHTAIWTGIEMIVWGGNYGGNTGARYDPTTDTWTPTTMVNVPFPRVFHSAVWTGTEMIVWGGAATDAGRYNPATDTWVTVDVPGFQTRDTAAVWTGTELVVWGGAIDSGPVDIGRRYDPAYETWALTSPESAPSRRRWHTGVWTGSEMIIWGGYPGGVVDPPLRTGARYNPLTDSWTPTSLVDAPPQRYLHTAVWTGTEMIVWGGQAGGNTGSRYNPATDSWVATGRSGAPESRQRHTAVLAGSEMIVWGGDFGGPPFNTGGRYCVSGAGGLK